MMDTRLFGIEWEGMNGLEELYREYLTLPDDMDDTKKREVIHAFGMAALCLKLLAAPGREYPVILEKTPEILKVKLDKILSYLPPLFQQVWQEYSIETPPFDHPDYEKFKSAIVIKWLAGQGLVLNYNREWRLGTELNAPALPLSDQLGFINWFLPVVKESGFYHAPGRPDRSASTHVHISAEDLQIEQLGKLWAYLVLIDTPGMALNALIPPHRRLVSSGHRVLYSKIDAGCSFDQICLDIRLWEKALSSTESLTYAALLNRLNYIRYDPFTKDPINLLNFKYADKADSTSRKTVELSAFPATLDPAYLGIVLQFLDTIVNFHVKNTIYSLTDRSFDEPPTLENVCASLNMTEAYAAFAHRIKGIAADDDAAFGQRRAPAVSLEQLKRGLDTAIAQYNPPTQDEIALLFWQQNQYWR